METPFLTSSQEEKLLNPPDDTALSPDFKLTDTEKKQTAARATGVNSGPVANESNGAINTAHVNKPTNKISMKKSKLDNAINARQQQKGATGSTGGAPSTSTVTQMHQQFVDKNAFVYTHQLSGAGLSSTVIDNVYTQQGTHSNMACHTMTSQSTEAVTNSVNESNEATISNQMQGATGMTSHDAMNTGAAIQRTVKHGQQTMLRFINTSQLGDLSDNETPVQQKVQRKNRKQRRGGSHFQARKAEAQQHDFDPIHAHGGLMAAELHSANTNQNQNRMQYAGAVSEYSQQVRSSEQVQRNNRATDGGLLNAQYGTLVGQHTGAAYSNINPNQNLNDAGLNPHAQQFLPNSFVGGTTGEMLHNWVHAQPGNTAAGATYPNLMRHFNQVTGTIPKQSQYRREQKQVTPGHGQSGRTRTHYKTLTPVQRLRNIKEAGAANAQNQDVGNLHDNKRSRVHGETPPEVTQHKKRPRTVAKAVSDANLLVAIADMPMPDFVAPMSRERYESLYKAINNLLFGDLENGGAMPTFVENHHTRGVMKIRCSTPATKHWLTCAVAYLPQLWIGRYENRSH